MLVAFEETTKIIPQLIAKGIGPQDIQIYFVDGNLADYSSENFDLTGVKGTLPVPADPDPGFNDRLLEIDPKLKDFSYGPQSYDAAIIIALAAIAADSDNGEAIGAEIINVTREGTQCSDVRGVRAAARGRRGHRLRRCQRSDRHERHR